MKYETIDEFLAPILESDPRYQVGAYLFVREGLDHTLRQLKEPRHVSGQELLEGLREYALKEFGPVSKRVLSEWGINECIDFGNIVFNLIEQGLLGKTDEDSIEDFSGGYDFTEAFIRPYRALTPPRCVIKRSVSVK